MSTYANPPPLRSYVDHWPKGQEDLMVKVNLTKHLGPLSNSYIDHWPEHGDGPVQTTRTVINSYVDHFAQAGDLYQNNKKGAWPGTGGY